MANIRNYKLIQTAFASGRVLRRMRSAGCQGPEKERTHVLRGWWGAPMPSRAAPGNLCSVDGASRPAAEPRAGEVHVRERVRAGCGGITQAAPRAGPGAAGCEQRGVQGPSR